MASRYTVNVTMRGETVSTLEQMGHKLYVFRVVQGSPGAKPVIWFQPPPLGLANTISWTEEYEAYTSHNEVIPRGKITVAASYPVNLGQVLQVDNPMGIGQVVTEGGLDGTLSIANLTSTRITAGISQTAPDGMLNPVCAFQLLGNNVDVIIPVKKIFLMLSSTPLNTGVVMEQAYGPGILIDLTDVSTRTVSYDADGGWTWQDQGSWAISYPPNQNLVPLLIQPMT